MSMMLYFQKMQLLLPLHLLEKPVCLFSLSQAPPPDLRLRNPRGQLCLPPLFQRLLPNCPLEAVTPLGWGGWGALLHLSEAQGLCGISMLTQRGSPG